MGPVTTVRGLFPLLLGMQELAGAGADGAVRRRALDLLTSMDDDPTGLDALLAGIDPGDDTEFARLLERARIELEY